MDVSAIVTRLSTGTSLAQVSAADPAGSPVNYDTSAALYSLLGSLVSNRMVPLTQKEDPLHPSITYQMVGSRQGAYDGFAITQTDTYILSIRADTYDALFDLVSSVKTTIAASSLAIEVTDLGFDYEEDPQVFVCMAEVEFTYLCAASQNLPAAFVYSLGRDASPSIVDNFTRQRVDDSYGILILTVTGNVSTLAGEIRSRILGWQQSAAHFEMEYRNGTQVAGIGGLRLWRETYQDGILISEI